MLLIFALVVVPTSCLLGAIAVDTAVWQSERRGAQKDADLSALAGAYQLILEQDQGDAETAAVNFANENDEGGNADSPVPGSDASVANSVVVDDACFPGNDILPLNSVSVNLNHNSRAFFQKFFNFNVAPDIGAHARACIGSPTNPVGLRPFILSIEQSPCFTGPADDRLPDFGEECTMDFGAHTDTEGTDIPGGNRGIADIEVPDGACSNKGGSGDIEPIIEFGAGNVRCGTTTGSACPQLSGYPLNTYGICVVGQTTNAQKVIDGVAALLSHEGDCDAAYSASPDLAGIDDFEEALEFVSGPAPGGSDPDNIYAPRPCNADGDKSPRIITIFAVDEWIGSNKEMPIRYFVSMYVMGCQPKDKPFSPTCDRDVDDLTPIGQVEVHGIIIKTFTAEIGDVAAPNEGGAFTLGLDE
jgi:hypothetical protein